MTMITLQMLKDMEPDTIFASGVFLYDGDNKQWVACRGGIWDWAIYYGQVYDTKEQIQRMGTKLHEMPEVKKLVNCTDEALAQYRH